MLLKNERVPGFVARHSSYQRDNGIAEQFINKIFFLKNLATATRQLFGGDYSDVAI